MDAVVQADLPTGGLVPTRTATTATGSPWAPHARSCCHPWVAVRRRSNGVAGYPGPVTGRRPGAGLGRCHADVVLAWWGAV